MPCRDRGFGAGSHEVPVSVKARMAEQSAAGQVFRIPRLGVPKHWKEPTLSPQGSLPLVQYYTMERKQNLLYLMLLSLDGKTGATPYGSYGHCPGEPISFPGGVP